MADRLAVDSPDTAAERQAQEQNELVYTPTLLTAFQTFQNISKSALPALSNSLWVCEILNISTLIPAILKWRS